MKRGSQRVQLGGNIGVGEIAADYADEIGTFLVECARQPVDAVAEFFRRLQNVRAGGLGNLGAGREGPRDGGARNARQPCHVGGRDEPAERAAPLSSTAHRGSRLRSITSFARAIIGGRGWAVSNPRKVRRWPMAPSRSGNSSVRRQCSQSARTLTERERPPRQWTRSPPRQWAG